MFLSFEKNLEQTLNPELTHCRRCHSTLKTSQPSLLFKRPIEERKKNENEELTLENVKSMSWYLKAENKDLKDEIEEWKNVFMKLLIENKDLITENVKLKAKIAKKKFF